MIVVTKISVDLQNPAFPAVVNAVQGDHNTRCLEVSVYSAGEAWNIPSDAVISMRYSKPDGTSGYYDTMPDGAMAAQSTKNVISMLLAPQMLTVPGSVIAQMELVQGSKILGTFPILVHVEYDPSVGVLESEDYVNWLQWMETELKGRMEDALATGEFTGAPGPKGDSGESAVLVSSEVTYQIGNYGTTPPSSNWSSSIPLLKPGKYLWTRQILRFNTGDPVISYSVARSGLDGTGTISTVCGINPDENGNIPLTANQIGAVPSSGGSMTGELNMNGQPISGLNAPTLDGHAASKGYVDARIDSLKPKPLWNGSWNSGSITVTGLSQYTVFKIGAQGIGTAILGVKQGSYVRGIGGYSSATPSITTYHFASTVSGDTLTFVAGNSLRHDAPESSGEMLDFAGHSNLAQLTITSIVGLL